MTPDNACVNGSTRCWSVGHSADCGFGAEVLMVLYARAPSERWDV